MSWRSAIWISSAAPDLDGFDLTLFEQDVPDEKVNEHDTTDR